MDNQNHLNSRLTAVAVAVMLFIPLLTQFVAKAIANSPSRLISHVSLLLCAALGTVMISLCSRHTIIKTQLKFFLIPVIIQIHNFLITGGVNFFIFLWVASVLITFLAFRSQITHGFDEKLFLVLMNVIFFLSYIVILSVFNNPKVYKMYSFANQNQLAGWMTTHFIINLIFLYKDIFSGNAKKIQWAINILLFVLAAYYAQRYDVRSCIVILVTTSFVYFGFILHRYQRRNFIFPLLFLMAMLLLGYSTFFSNLTMGSGRIALWKVGLTSWASNGSSMLFGYGLDSFVEYFKKYGDNYSGKHFWMQSFHNIFITTLFNFGIAGLLVVAVSILKSSKRLLLNCWRPGWVTLLFLGINLGITGNYIHAWFYIPAIFIFLMTYHDTSSLKN